MLLVELAAASIVHEHPKSVDPRGHHREEVRPDASTGVLRENVQRVEHVP